MNDLMTFENNVKERMKSIVADLIPEDRWDNLVKVTVQDFEKNDLPKLVKAELTAEEYRMYDDPLARLRSEAEQRARGHIKSMIPWGACA